MIENKIIERFEPILKEMGYELVELRFQKEFGIDTLTVFIYKKGGVELSDCEIVTAKLDPVLDEMDIIQSSYNFNISSPGLDRPIVSNDDFRRNLDEEIEIVFKEPIRKKKSAHGTLLAYTEEKITLLTPQNKEETYEKSIAMVIRPYINFK